MSSLLTKSVRGSAWIIATSIGARAIGVVGTLFLTRFISPNDYGEVQAAAIVVMTASQLSSFGLGQYLIAHPQAPPDAAFHATFYHIAAGIPALLITLMFGHKLGYLVGAPNIGPFLPGLVLSLFLERIVFMPERILVRDMRFRRLGVIRTLGEVTYTICSIGLAILGWSAMAIVVGNIVRSLVRMALMTSAASLRDWLTPYRLTWTRTRELFAFGLPISIASLSTFASRRWDNLIISALFGPSTLGAYNLAYNLADIPAVQVGEQISDVLLPSFARLEPERRLSGLTRSLSLLSLLMSPLAIGLGVIAPTLVQVLFDKRWSAVGPMLVLLSALSVSRPFSGVVWSYLQVYNRPRLLMMLEIGKIVCLLIFLFILGKLGGPLWACGAVGIAFCGHTAVSLWFINKLDGLPWHTILASVGKPLLACIPMGATVLAIRHLRVGLGWHQPLVGLLLEIAMGSITYMGAAFVFARSSSREFLHLLREALQRRQGHTVEA